MADPITLMTVLMAGGAAMAQAVVEEVTKDAWQKLKAAVGEQFGKQASRAVVKLEADASSEEGKRELQKIIAELDDETALELAPSIKEMADAIHADANARDAVARCGINLDLVIENDIVLSRIRGVDNLNVRAKAGGNFALTDIEMGPKDPSGN